MCNVVCVIFVVILAPSAIYTRALSFATRAVTALACLKQHEQFESR